MEIDFLKLRRLTGSNLLSLPPIFSADGEVLFKLNHNVVQLFSTKTGERIRELIGATEKLISLELELKQNDIIVACTETGVLLRWEWQSGTLIKKLELKLVKERVLTCNLINSYHNSETANVFVTYKNNNKKVVQWVIFDTHKGSQRQVRCTLPLKKNVPIVAVDNTNFNYIAVVQGFYVYFIDYTTFQWTRLKSANSVPFTVVRVHPKERLAATGDQLGRIFLWRGFMKLETLKTSLYHWHHTTITDVAFSTSGTSFYSSGFESVLVKWNIAKPEVREYMPRMGTIVRHIVICKGNNNVAICTSDSGVRIINSDKELKCTLQDFTFIPDDKTGKNRFPVGLCFNPRSNTLALNGRIGHLQFYSVHTKSLLFNLDVVMQNQLSMETHKILYNINVEKAAFNIDWMATAEIFDDREHTPELRLKFWKYKEKIHNYVLNTVVENPHNDGISAIEFSSSNSVDNLLCATIGYDNIIKIWSLDSSDDIYKKDKYWCNIAQTSYKEMPIVSLSFAQDSSLLAAGFGNTLCIYEASTLKLKVALSSAVGMDGVLQKAQIRAPKTNNENAQAEMHQQRSKFLKLFVDLLQDGDKKALTTMQEILATINPAVNMQESPKTLKVIDQEHKKYFYNKILETQELNFYQKVLLYQKLGISSKTHPNVEARMAAYLHQTIAKDGIKQKLNDLHNRLQRLSKREYFKAKYRLQSFTKRKHNYDNEIEKNLVSIMSLLNLKENTMPRRSARLSKKEKSVKNLNKSFNKTTNKILPPPQSSPEIVKVQFASGQYAHLVVVCTDNRVLVWNLLTLRLQSVSKLSMQHFTFDAQTNIVAIVNKNDELYVFQPNVPLPLYYRCNMPKMYGAAWFPRRYARQSSLNIDWQAQSSLLFLTQNQDIMYLSKDDDIDANEPKPIIFNKEAVPLGLQYSIFGNYATKQNEAKAPERMRTGPLITGSARKEAIKSFINMSSHTMPPMHLLSEDLLKCMLNTCAPEKTTKAHHSEKNSVLEIDVDSDSDDGVQYKNKKTHEDSENHINDVAGDFDVNMKTAKMNGDTKNSKNAVGTRSKKIEVRRHFLNKAEEISKQLNSSNLQTKSEIELEKLLDIFDQNISFDF